ncbi:MAG: GNAT family N-acetyltransferase [Odoribacter sp.]|nr:GNAT family N-acetyltransferase [Odoribacter sp.]
MELNTKPVFTLRPATKTDAGYISRAVIMAVGEEIALHLAGSPDRLHLVNELFTRLAARDDSQYSYRNSIIACTPAGAVAGVIVAYDGAQLQPLRKAFIEEAAKILGIHINEAEMHDETSPDEIYLDSLAVWPEYRGNKLAYQLINAAATLHSNAGKPIGLLCEPENHRARRLYVASGFIPVGQRPFAGTMMDHMVLKH